MDKNILNEEILLNNSITQEAGAKGYDLSQPEVCIDSPSQNKTNMVSRNQIEKDIGFFSKMCFYFICISVCLLACIYACMCVCMCTTCVPGVCGD